jgi:hypothetical protein
MSSRSRYLIGAAAVTAVFLVPYLYFTEPATDRESARSSEQPGDPAATPSPAIAAQSSSSPALVAVSAITKPASLSTEVKLLSSSTNSADAFKAFELLSYCKWAQEDEKRFQNTKLAERSADRLAERDAGTSGPQRIAQLCGDLTPADFTNRLALLERAAEAAVPMAAVRFSSEGPFGDYDALYHRWNDPAVQEWRAKTIRLLNLAAEKGDVSALASIAAQYETGSGLIAERNPELALKYTVAKQVVYEAQTGRKQFASKWEIDNMSAKLSPDDALKARAEGQGLAKTILKGGTK